MKNLFITSICLLVCLLFTAAINTAEAQSSKTPIVEIDMKLLTIVDINSKYIGNGEFKQETETRESVEISYLGVIDTDKDIISFNNKQESKYFLKEYKNTSVEIDSDGDKYYQITIDSVDEEGIECTVVITLYEELSLTYVYAIFDEMAITWLGNRRDLKAKNLKL